MRLFRRVGLPRLLILSVVMMLLASACSTADTGDVDENTSLATEAQDSASDDTGDDSSDSDDESESGDSETDGESVASRPLRVLTAEPTSGLDPATAVTKTSIRVIELLYDGLLDYNSDGDIVPGLAQSWEISEDERTYTFTLQPNAGFSDGSPVTAQDVVFSLERAAEGEALGSSLQTVESIEAIDETTVEVTLAEPSRVFLNTLARVGAAGILSEEAVSGSEDYFTMPTATSGPWVLTEYIPADHLTLEANEHYWQGPPSIGRIDYTFGDDPTAEAAALQSGTADISWPMAPNDAIRLEELGAIEMYVPPAVGTLFWGLNTTEQPFDDVRVREAVAWMVPRADRLEVCWQGIGGLSYGETILEGSWAYVEGLDKFDVPAEEALANANALLDEAGWIMGDNEVRQAQGVEGVDDGTPLEVDVPFESGWQQSRCNTELLRDRLLPAGISIQPQAYDGSSYWSDVADGSFTMFHGGNGWATDDDMMEQAYTTEGQSNSIVAQWSNATVDELVRQAHATQDIDEARALYEEVQQIILDELPMINTGAQYSIVGATPDLKGYETRPDISNRSLIHATLSEG